jgi:hypothetical protein
MYAIEKQLEASQNRRMAREGRFAERRDMIEDKAAALVGILIRDGMEVFYINRMDRLGNLTGKTKEFRYMFQAIDYAIRNHYV